MYCAPACFATPRSGLPKEFTRGLQAMLFEAHEALIASNAWLVQRLKEVVDVSSIDLFGYPIFLILNNIQNLKSTRHK